MRSPRIFFSVIAAAVWAGPAIPSADASGHNDKAALRKCAGFYKGQWINPNSTRISTGQLIRTLPSLPLKLRIPPRKAKTTSRIDLSPDSGLIPHNTRLIIRFGKPRVRRRGKLIIYRGKAVWKLQEAAAGSDTSGQITLRVLKRGRGAVIRKNNIRLLSALDDAAISGRITARK